MARATCGDMSAYRSLSSRRLCHLLLLFSPLCAAMVARNTLRAEGGCRAGKADLYCSAARLPACLACHQNNSSAPPLRRHDHTFCFAHHLITCLLSIYPLLLSPYHRCRTPTARPHNLAPLAFAPAGRAASYVTPVAYLSKMLNRCCVFATTACSSQGNMISLMDAGISVCVPATPATSRSACKRTCTSPACALRLYQFSALRVQRRCLCGSN